MSKYTVSLFADNELQTLIYSGPAEQKDVSHLPEFLLPENLVKTIQVFPAREFPVNDVKGARVYENGAPYATVDGFTAEWHPDCKIGPSASLSFYVCEEDLA